MCVIDFINKLRVLFWRSFHPQAPGPVWHHEDALDGTVAHLKDRDDLVKVLAIDKVYPHSRRIDPDARSSESLIESTQDLYKSNSGRRFPQVR
jgi:hypothetical protein